MATTTNTTPIIVTQFEISFANDEIVCLKDGRHFLPAEVHIVESSIERSRLIRELKWMDRMIEALEAADKEPTKVKINRQDVIFANQHIVATKDNTFTPDEVEIVDENPKADLASIITKGIRLVDVEAAMQVIEECDFTEEEIAMLTEMDKMGWDEIEDRILG